MHYSFTNRNRARLGFLKFFQQKQKQSTLSKSHFLIVTTIFILALSLSFLIPLSRVHFYITDQSKRILINIAINVLFLLIFAFFLCKSSRSSNSLLNDQWIVLLTVCILISNFELYWVWNERDYAALVAIFILALLPSSLYTTFSLKCLHWTAVITYYGLIHFRITDNHFILIVTLNVMLIIILSLFFLRKHEQESLNKALTLDLLCQISNMSSTHSNKVNMVLDKNQNLVYGNEMFYKFFGAPMSFATPREKIEGYLQDITRVACSENFLSIIGEKEVPSPRKPDSKNKLSSKAELLKLTSLKNMQFFKTLANDSQDGSLKTIINLLFKYPATFKKFNIGWNSKKNTSAFYSTMGYHEAQQLFLNFSFLSFYREDLVFIELTPSEEGKVFGSTPSNLSMMDIASVIHEIRTPLNGVMFLVQQALEDETVSLKIKENLLLPCLNSSKRLKYIVNDILDFAQILEGKFRLVFENFDLASVLNEAIQIIDALARPKGVQVSLEIDPMVPSFITTDPNRLIQIIYNIMGNSVKFTKVGYVKLNVIMSQKYPNLIDFTVEDTGYGIKKQDLKNLFKVFEKLDNWHDNKIGSGLGLCIANALAKTLGKAIKVESEFQKGSKFTFGIENQTKGNCASGKTILSLDNTERLDFENTERKSPLDSLDEYNGKRSFASSILDTPKIEFNSIASRRESNEVIIEFPTKTNQTVYFDFNLPSCHTIKRTDSKLKRNEYQIKIDPGVEKTEKEDGFLSHDSNRLNTNQPMISTRSLHSGRGKTSLKNLRALEQLPSCACVKMFAVDDDQVNLIPLQFFSNDCGIKAEFFNNGDSLIEHLKTNATKLSCDKCKGPLFILMDCYMPIKNGFETTSELVSLMKQGLIKEIPIIACTADESCEMSQKTKDYGMKGCIHKPVQRFAFENLLQKFGSSSSIGNV